MVMNDVNNVYNLMFIITRTHVSDLALKSKCLYKKILNAKPE